MPTGLCVPKHMSWMWGPLVFVVLSAVVGVVLGSLPTDVFSHGHVVPRAGSHRRVPACALIPRLRSLGTALHELMLPARGPQD